MQSNVHHGAGGEDSLAQSRMVPSDDVNIHELSAAMLYVHLGCIFLLPIQQHLCPSSNSDVCRENLVEAHNCVYLTD